MTRASRFTQADRALNFIENTESEHGVTLESGDLLRAALNETQPVSAGRGEDQ